MLEVGISRQGEEAEGLCRSSMGEIGWLVEEGQCLCWEL